MKRCPIVLDNQVIGEFDISPMPGCSAIGVFHGVKIAPEFRGRGLGTRAHAQRLEIARMLGYKMVQATTVEGNKVEEVILTKFGWQMFGAFLNTKTQHTVCVWKKYLDPNVTYEELYGNS